MGYNTDLYGNLTQAQYSANGLAVIGILVQVGTMSDVNSYGRCVSTARGLSPVFLH